MKGKNIGSIALSWNLQPLEVQIQTWKIPHCSFTKHLCNKFINVFAIHISAAFQETSVQQDHNTRNTCCNLPRCDILDERGAFVEEKLYLWLEFNRASLRSTSYPDIKFSDRTWLDEILVFCFYEHLGACCFINCRKYGA